MGARCLSFVALVLLALSACATTVAPVAAPSAAASASPFASGGSPEGGEADVAEMPDAARNDDASSLLEPEVDAGSHASAPSASCVHALADLDAYARRFSRCTTDADCVLVKPSGCIPANRGPGLPYGRVLGFGHTPAVGTKLERAAVDACGPPDPRCPSELLNASCQSTRLVMPVAGHKGPSPVRYDRRCEASVPCAPPFESLRFIDEAGQAHVNPACF